MLARSKPTHVSQYIRFHELDRNEANPHPPKSLRSRHRIPPAAVLGREQFGPEFTAEWLGQNGVCLEQDLTYGLIHFDLFEFVRSPPEADTI